MKEFENELYESGIKYIAGIDEVGRGPLVGPVVTAAVILPRDFYDERIKDYGMKKSFINSDLIPLYANEVFILKE